ncbi:MAG: hypothetical protein Q7J07_10575 [Pelolinea sp.]|nr:hypothetical protein [Pelolinea sp.]
MVANDTKKLSGWISLLVVCGLLITGGITPVHADIEDDPITAPEKPYDRTGVKMFLEGVLMHTFRYQRSMTDFFGVSLDRAEDAIFRAETRIDELDDEGKNVADLEGAITQAKLLIDEAENAYIAVQIFMDLHSGFDTSGRVVDTLQAGETVKAVEPELRLVREKIIEAVRVIMAATKNFQTKNDI